MSFSLTRPPPGSTLFPYTTLFRSLDDRAICSDLLVGCDEAVAEEVQADVRVADRCHLPAAGLSDDRALIVREPDQGIDLIGDQRGVLARRVDVVPGDFRWVEQAAAHK